MRDIAISSPENLSDASTAVNKICLLGAQLLTNITSHL